MRPAISLFAPVRLAPLSRSRDFVSTALALLCRRERRFPKSVRTGQA